MPTTGSPRTLQDMYRLLSLVAAASLATLTNAQVTVDQNDLPQGGVTHVFQNVTPDLFLDVESSGPGWVWDFSSLTVVDSTALEVHDIGNASFTSQFVFNGFDSNYQADHFYTFLNVPDFGEAGGEALPIELDEVVGYHQYANGTYNLVGLGLTIAGFELPVAFDDVDEVHPFPLTVDAALESTASYTIQVPATLTYAVDQTRYSAIDGYGTLLLPDGTSHEVLRLKSTVLSFDSIYFDLAGEGFAFERETVTYSWLSDGGMPWMEVSTTFGIPSVVRYQGSAPFAPSGLQDLTEAPHLFPNPVQAGQSVRLGTNDAVRWTVHTLAGSLRKTTQGTILSTEGWPPGMYFVRNEGTGSIRRLLIR